MMAYLEGETMDRIAALTESSRELSGILALVVASTPGGELSASEMDALTDLSYKIQLNLDQLSEVWAQVSDELTAQLVRHVIYAKPFPVRKRSKT